MLERRQKIGGGFFGHPLQRRDLFPLQGVQVSRVFDQFGVHQHAQQFFYVVKGTATFEINETFSTVHTGEGIHVHAAKAMGDLLIVGLNSDAQKNGFGPGW